MDASQMPVHPERQDDLQSVTSNQFLAQSNLRLIVALLLGFVCMSSLISLVHSQAMRSIRQRIRDFWRGTMDRSEKDIEAAAEKPPLDQSPDPQTWNLSARNTLAFAQYLCFAFSSLAFFSTQLSFHESGGVACAFLFASGGMADQSARLLGILVIGLKSREFGISRVESAVVSIWLGIAIVLLFATNAISTGMLRSVQSLDIALCYKQHFLPVSLAASLVRLTLEGYLTVRLASSIAPSFMLVKHRVGALKDPRILQALSLVLMELLTLVPQATDIGVLGEFVPFSIGALIVIAAFTHTNPRGAGAPPSMSGRLSTRPSTAPSARSTISIRHISTSTVASAMEALRASLPNHPFSAGSLADPAPTPGPRESWVSPGARQPRSARSSRTTIDSVTAKSIRGAVVQVASRSRRPFPALPPPLPAALRPVPKIWVSRPGLPVSVRPPYREPVSAWSKSTESSRSADEDARTGSGSGPSRPVSVAGAVESAPQGAAARRNTSPGAASLAVDPGAGLPPKRFTALLEPSRAVLPTRAEGRASLRGRDGVPF